jgi:pectate lyase
MPVKPSRIPPLLLTFTLLAASGPPRAVAASERADVHVPAFPGAEGAGAKTPGGRGGAVLLVTNLNDHGPGSLRAAVEAEGPRTVLFRVAGLITLESRLVIEHPFITIAGQTAPGDGVCIRGQSVHINTHDVVIRYLRFRRGNLQVRDDALGGYPIGDVIIDHVSASWGLDENLSLYRHMVPVVGARARKVPVERLTIQWSISSEALDPNNHAFGGTWGGPGNSFHHNLFACNTGRNPSIGTGGVFDFRNNVLFNWQHRSIDGGDGSSQINLVANYFKPGPATWGADLRRRICKIDTRSARYDYPGVGKWHVAENVVEGSPEVTADNWAGGVQFGEARREKGVLVPQGTVEMVRAFEPFPASPITQDTAAKAYERVLDDAGASLPRRDDVDRRVIASVRNGQPAVGNGIINSPADVGGWPEYRSAPTPADADADGMPDDWEARFGLASNDPSDVVRDGDGDGYTAIEEYLNGTDPTAFVDYTKPENNRNVFQLPRPDSTLRAGR